MLTSRIRQICLCSQPLTRTSGIRVLLFLLMCFLASPIDGAERKTTFLPLRIVAPQTDDVFVAQVDDSLAAALMRSDMTMLYRQNAEKLVNYSQWPPESAILEKVALKTGHDNVAVGSLTVIGSRISVDVKVYDLLAPERPKYFTEEADSVDKLNYIIDQIVDRVVDYTEREQFIAVLTPEGNKRIDSGAILRKIKTKTGDRYNPTALRQDLKEIYKMGYFEDVKINVKDGTDGKEIIFSVIEKPTISSISYAGLDELDEKDLVEAITVKENSILNPARINDAAEAIKALYKSKGFYNTEVTPNISHPTSDTAAVRFVVDEGEKIYIKKIGFAGNSTFSDDDLEDVIETDTKNWLSWLTEAGLLDRDLLSQDASRIVAFYQNNGFLEARVGEPAVTQEGKWLYVKFSIDEGPRFKVGTVDIEGDLIADKKVFLDMLSIREEQFLNRKAMRDDILKITDYYAEQGYAFAEIRPRLDKSAGGSRVDIVLDVTRGDLVYINRIVIRGNTHTRDNVIRRELQVAEGGVFDAKGLRASSRKLQRLEYFEEVNITPEPALDPAKMNIMIDLKEKSTGQMSVGGGYSSVDKLVLTGEISQNNLFGMGHRLALSGSIGGSSSRYNLSWTDPRVFDSQISMGVDLFNWLREYDDYTKNSKGGALRFGHPLWEEWRMYESYSYTDTDLNDVREDASFIIRESEKVPVTSALKLSFVRDTRDRLYGASDGSRNSLSVKYAGGPFQGDAQFTKAEAESGWYFAMPFGTVFHVLGSAGQVWENDTDKLPVYERFYLGGLNSIRGFEYGKVSPIDEESGDRIGGNRMWYVNTEIVLPLFKDQGVYGVIFFDAGNAIAEDQDFTLDGTAKATGLEFRWISPLAPIRIVWGYNLDPRDDESQTVWDFSIGGQF